MASAIGRSQESGLREAEMMHLFPVPVLRYRWPETERLNAELKQVVLARMERSPGVVKTNRGGWQSDSNLQDWTEAPIRDLLGKIQSLMRELVTRTVPDPDSSHLTDWTLRGWANVNQKGHFNRAHHHIGASSIWSGIYYVDVGELGRNTSVTGGTIFEDRSLVPKEVLRNPDPFERQVRIVPENGLMVVFPASLYHSVEPYSGEGVRITIAFNLGHPAFTVPMYDGMEDPSWWWHNFRGLMIIPAKVPEKLGALRRIPRELLARKLPRSARWGPWRDHIRAALEHASAQASAAADRARGRAGR